MLRTMDLNPFACFSYVLFQENQSPPVSLTTTTNLFICAFAHSNSFYVRVQSENTDPNRVPQDGESSEVHLSPRHDDDATVPGDTVPANATFLVPAEAHPNPTDRDEDISKLRLLAGKLSADWRGHDFMAPALARRIRDFSFAQEKRRRTYGEERPWGILGLYDHLAAIRLDVAWAEDAAWRRANGEPYMSWSEFDSSRKKGINRPFFTFFLLIVCTVLLVASIALNGWKVEPLDVNPMIGPSAETLIRMGAKDSDLIVNYGESWRLFTSIFLHAGLVHFFINMLALWFVGSAIERTHGILSTVVLFVIPAVGGTILSAIFLPDYITVGASGGIFGLIGACLSDIAMNWKLLFSDVVNEKDKKHSHAMVLIVLVFDILLNCIIGLTPYVDNFTRKCYIHFEGRRDLFRFIFHLTMTFSFRFGWNDLWVLVWRLDDGTTVT
jgi:membrane associated rhomboid family serine protease